MSLLLTTDPIWSDSVSEKQHVVDDLAADFLYGGPISKSFERLPIEFLLDNNVKVYIYKKNFFIPDDVINNLSETFLSYYPDNNQYKFSANTINQKGSYGEK